MKSSSSRKKHLLQILFDRSWNKRWNIYVLHCRWYQVSILIGLFFPRYQGLQCHLLNVFSMLSYICIYVYIQNRNSLEGAQGQQTLRKRQKTSKKNCTWKLFLHTRNPAIFDVSASIAQPLQYSTGPRHNHKKEPRLLPATGGIKYTAIKPKNNVGSPGLLSDNGNDTPHDHGGARHTHTEGFVTMSYEIDSEQSTGFIYNDSLGDSRVLTEISKGV